MATPILWEEMLPTPTGPLWLSFTERGLQAINFYAPAAATGPVWPVGQLHADLTARLRHWRQEVATALTSYFAGRVESFRHLTLDLHGTPFQLQVWEALRRVPYGCVTTYQELAQALGLPRGARAVGSALGANPVPIIIPCHRVLASDGSLGGYRAGVRYKRQLLSLERQARGQGQVLWPGPLTEG
ncbi:MAG: methylated-DNA--[protein]-cysteine S-methyltransferase [Desulfobacca sp.]|uniref:methylated-DNA--[protein]-cysteine S-methyltransferase n=1 Tax=Desulfobacca sp. TaxID=2067990 RepID=UPI00404A1F43